MTAVNTLTAVLDRLATSPNDEDAWRSLYRQLWPFVIAVIYRRLKNRSAAEDAAQEVFVRVLNSRPFEKIQVESEFRAYVWRIAVNVANTHLKNARRKEHGEHKLIEWGSTFYEPPETDDRILMEEALRLAREGLEPQDTKLLHLILQGRSLREVASELGLTYTNVGVRFHRLKKKVHKLLNNNNN